MDEGNRDQDKMADGWLTDWENEAIADWERREPNMDDRLQNESERSSQILWHSFQNSATSIAKLYKGTHVFV